MKIDKIRIVRTQGATLPGFPCHFANKGEPCVLKDISYSVPGAFYGPARGMHSGDITDMIFRATDIRKLTNEEWGIDKEAELRAWEDFKLGIALGWLP